MLDSKGVISTERTDLNEQKKFFATSRTDIHTLAEAVKDADVFVGLSKGNVLSQDMVKSMAKDPVNHAPPVKAHFFAITAYLASMSNLGKVLRVASN